MGFDLKKRAALHRFARATSRDYGIEIGLEELRRASGFFPWQFYRTIVADGLSVGSSSSHGGASASDDPALTALCAYGESLERYCLAISETSLERMRQTSYEAIAPKARALAPDEFPLFTDAQFASTDFKCQRWTADLPLDWILAENLTSQQPLWIPSDFVTYGSQAQTPIFANSSSGCALGSSFADATINAAFECIERDSVMGTWWNQISPPRIDPLTVQDETTKAILSYFAQAQIPVFLLDATSDLDVPVAIVAICGDSERRQPAFLMASAAKFTMEAAIKKACFEVFQNSIRGHYLGVRRQYTQDYNKEIRTFDDGVFFYCQPEHAEICRFLLEGPRQSGSTDPKNLIGGSAPQANLEKLVDRLEKFGYPLLAADFTSRDVRSLGFHAVRAIVPGLIPLNGAHRYRPWGVKRIYDFRSRMKQGERTLEEKDLYPFPHPFP